MCVFECVWLLEPGGLIQKHLIHPHPSAGFTETLQEKKENMH